MQALRKVKLGETRLELQDLPEPVVKPGHVVIAVAAAGICGTDLHIMKDEYRSRPPVTLGHEVAGTLLELGEGVSGWQVGQRVVSETYFSVCGLCEFCRTGRPNLCAERASIGSFVDGAFAPRVVVPVRNLHALPDSIGFPEAALMEPLACVVRGLLELNHLSAGDKVAIAGPGAIGLLALLVAKAAGAQVLVLGTPQDSERLELALRLGADGVLDATVAWETLAAGVQEQLGDAPQVVIECSGAPPAAGTLLHLVKKAGRYIQVGLYGQRVTLDFDTVCYKELQVSGSFATTPSSWYRALSLASSGVVPLERLVGNVYPIAAWAEAFDSVMGRSPGKTFIIP